MRFERGKDPKETLEIGIKEEKGYNISHITDKKVILPGINPNDIYKITHSGSRSVSGFCSGKKVMKVLLSLMKDGFKDYQEKWIWSPSSWGGSLLYYYADHGDDFWVDANNTLGYSFSRMDETSIMEL